MKKVVYVFTKVLLEKGQKLRKLKKTNNLDSVPNLWRILGTKLVLLVDF